MYDMEILGMLDIGGINVLSTSSELDQNFNCNYKTVGGF